MLLPFNRAEAQAAATHTLFGKLQNRADFVRVNANHPAALELDQLIQQSYERATSLDEQSASPANFLYTTRDRRYTAIGVAMPSRDQAGRKYPLVAAAILPREALEADLPLSPIAYEVFFDGLREQVINAVENSVEALSCRQFLETTLRSYEASASDDLQLARNVVERFLDSWSCAQVQGFLAGDLPGTTLHQALLNMAFYQAHLRHFDNRATNQLIGLPLGLQKGEQALLASLWLNILASLFPARSRQEPWNCSYFIHSPAGGPARLVVSLGRMPDGFTGAMLGTPTPPSLMLDLSQEQGAWSSHRMYAEVSYALSRMLADPEVRLAPLCSLLEGIGRQLDRDG